VHIGRLRKALGSAGHPDPIRTARSAGYFLTVCASGSAKRAAR
jgi:DNA-binding response OmpR family regulator